MTSEQLKLKQLDWPIKAGIGVLTLLSPYLGLTQLLILKRFNRIPLPHNDSVADQLCNKTVKHSALPFLLGAGTSLLMNGSLVDGGFLNQKLLILMQQGLAHLN